MSKIRNSNVQNETRETLNSLKSPAIQKAEAPDMGIGILDFVIGTFDI
jgi:hypothetical protein